MVKYTSVAMQLLPLLDICWEQVQDHALGKAAVVWIYGEYGQVNILFAQVFLL